jgi:hypothetical protein
VVTMTRTTTRMMMNSVFRRSMCPSLVLYSGYCGDAEICMILVHCAHLRSISINEKSINFILIPKKCFHTLCCETNFWCLREFLPKLYGACSHRCAI